MKFILEERFILHEGPDTETKSWEQQFADCTTPEDFKKFWQKYYSEVWGAQAELVKNIGIETCLQTYGWEDAENPLLKFLHTIGTAPINGVGLKTITSPDFDMLCTAFDENTLTAEDLINGGEFKKYNLIYNPNLYTQFTDEHDQLEMLRLQRDFKGFTGANGITVGPEGRGIAFANTYLAARDSRNFTNAAGLIPGGKLKDLARLTKIIDRLVTREKPVKKIADSAVQTLIDNIKPEHALIYFVGAFDTFETLDSGIITFTDAQVKSGPTVTDFRSHATSIDHDKVKEAAKKLKIKSGSYSNRQAARLLIGIANKAGASIIVKDESEET